MAGVSCDHSKADENKQGRMEVDVSELSKDENDVSIQHGGNQCGAESHDQTRRGNDGWDLEGNISLRQTGS